MRPLITYNSRGEDLGCYYVTGDGVAEGPSEGIQVDEDDSDDAASGSAAYIAVGRAGIAEAYVEC